MPLYSFYPQGRGASGEKIDAHLATPEDARDRANEILAARPDAAEISIWCDDEYVGRVGNEPWTPPAKAAADIAAALPPPAKPPRRRAGRPARPAESPGNP